MILPDVATKSHAELHAMVEAKLEKLDRGVSTLDLNWQDFELGFWHPFGSHGRESPEDIINRKRNETEKNGWTLWSFQYRRPESLEEWYGELSCGKPRKPVVVFCSMGDSAVDPDRPGALTKTVDCHEYRFIGHNDENWSTVPPLIRVPHPFGPRKIVASAFVVRRVHHPINYSGPLLWSGFPAVTGMKVPFRRGLNTSSAEAAKSQCGIYARFSNCSRPIWRL